MKKTVQKNSPGSAGKQQETHVVGELAVEVGTTMFSDMFMKKIFFFSLFTMLLITWVGGFNVGYHQDEIDMNAYGKACCSYYSSGGKDKAFLSSNERLYRIDSFLRYYGCGFEYFAIAANKLTGNAGGKQEFNVRHIVNQFFGIVALLFAGLVARKLFDWRVAIVAIWLAFCSPSFFGHVFFNTKDIPFCAGYIAALYYTLCFLEELPLPSWKTTLKLMLAFAFTTDIRIAGILWIFYLLLFTMVYLFTNRDLLNNTIKNATSISLRYVVVIFCGMALVVVTWPFLLQNPVRNIIGALQLIQKYPMKININFGGEAINSLTLPSNYIPTLLGITTPIYILVFVVVGLLFCIIRYSKVKVKSLSVLLFTAVFPLAYAIITHAVMYSGWRHFLFIYPSICIISAFGVVTIADYLQKKMLKVAFLIVSVLLMLHPVVWGMKNHPYEYCYFNEISGGYKNVYYNYDTDYWQITMKNAIDWMMKNQPIAASNDTVVVATNIPFFVDYYIAVQYPQCKVKVVSVGCAARNLQDWHYAVFSNFMLKPDYLENFFPPKTTCFTESIDGYPSTVILKDTARLDEKAVNAIVNANYPLADSLFTRYLATTHDNNPVLGAYIGFSKAILNQNDVAIEAANSALQYYFSNETAYYAYFGLGLAYANKKQFPESVEALKTAQKLVPGDPLLGDVLNHVYIAMQNDQANAASK